MDPDAVDEVCSSDGSSGHLRGEGDQTRGANRVKHGGSDSPRLLDFSTIINPRTPEGIARVYESTFAAARSYPADDYAEFRVTAGEYAGCEPASVVPTGGDLAGIRLAIATTVTSDDSVLVPYPSSGAYAREVRLQGGEPTFVHYEDVLDIDPSAFALVVVCTPNDPTGDTYRADRLRRYADWCREVGTPLLVDESFVELADADSLAGYEGTIVVRSLTRLFGLPGLRAGFVVATGQYRERLDATRLPWGVSVPAAAVGTHCMRQSEFVTETRAFVREERERMRTRLADRFDVHPSDAPFLLLELRDGGCVEELTLTLRQHGIRVRDARTFRELDANVRVTVRRPHENDRLLDALDV